MKQNVHDKLSGWFKKFVEIDPTNETVDRYMMLIQQV